MSRIFKSLASQATLLFIVFTLTFIMIRSLPGDLARAIAGEKATAQTLEEVRENLGLNQPLPVQYVKEAKKIFLHGDLGYNYKKSVPVKDELFEKLPATIELASLAMIFALLLGVPLGMLAARFRGKWLDVALTQFSLMGVSVPVFLLGILLILFFETSENFGISGRMPTDYFGEEYSFYFWGSLFTADFDVFEKAWSHIFLPAITLATIPMSIIMRLTRSAVLDVIKEDFLRTARAKGLGEFKIYLKHILRVISPSLVTLVGLQVGLLMSGAVLTETVFGWPGMGRYLIESIDDRAYSVLQACILFFAVVFIVVHFLVDLCYVVLDPRVREE